MTDPSFKVNRLVGEDRRPTKSGLPHTGHFTCNVVY